MEVALARAAGPAAVALARAAGQICGGCFGRNKIKRSQVEDEVDTFTVRELAHRPEVRIMNRYAVTRAYILMGMKGLGSLALLWASVVLLGGFVTMLNKKDFWYLTIMSFVQAAGLINALGGDQFGFFFQWTLSQVEEYLGNISVDVTYSIGSEIIYFVTMVTFYPVLLLSVYGPCLCFILSCLRLGLGKVDYGRADGAANLNPALNIFYSLSLAQGAIFMLWCLTDGFIGLIVVASVSRRHGFDSEVVDNYFHDIKFKCVEDPACTEKWNLITYGAGLLDSVLPDDYLRGARVLNMLIEQGIPIRRLLIRSPRHRIETLIGTLGRRISVSADRETRGLAARIVAHLAGDLNLARFPGALECISSLLETTCHKNGDQEALHFPTESNQTKSRPTKSRPTKFRPLAVLVYKLISDMIRNYQNRMKASTQDSKNQGKEANSNSGIGTNEDLIVQGLRILENLAHDQQNCTEIYKTNGLLLKITSPVSSVNLVEDIKNNAAWIKVVDGSLKVVSRLMGAPGDTGIEMRRQIAGNSNAVKNLEVVLDLEINSNTLELQTRAIEVLELQTRAIEVVAQLFFDESISLAREKREHFIKRVLQIFLTDEGMEGKMKQAQETWGSTGNAVHGKSSTREKREHFIEMVLVQIFLTGERMEEEMKQAQETVSWLKEKAGEALAMLSMGSQSNSEIIRSYTGCGRVVIHCLTEMLGSKIKTVIRSTSGTEDVETEIKIGCRIRAAEILKHLCDHDTLDDDYVKQTTLKKVLEELLQINTETQEQAGNRSTGNISAARRQDIENPPPRGGDQHEHATPRSGKQQSEERRLQAALLSLCAATRSRCINAGDFASVLAQLIAREDFVGKLKDIVEENRYATPACLAIQKLTCEMVTSLMLHDQCVKEIEGKKIIDALSQASETMAGLESCMLFAGTDRDCHGVPVKPLFPVLVKQARELLRQKLQELGMNTSAGGP